MISKTSLFNKGIYKSTLRRYLWGSVLYFVILFVVTGMMIMLNEDPQYVNAYWSSSGRSTILETDYIIIPMLLSIVVPTVAGLLIFRYIHSKKASVFTHSLPVKRSANYISSVLAALTLMAVPVILNAAILVIMSVTVYSLHFTVGHCIVWMLLNLFSIFAMFSCVCFVASITGNSFAMVGLNVLFHTIGLILAASFSMLCEIFLHGFAGESTLIDKVFNNIFITRIPTIMTNWGYAKEEIIKGYTKDIAAFLIVAVLIYIISGFLYSKRRMETAEDVAGFRCLNHIFKYLVTFVGAITAFAILCFSIYKNPLTLFVTVLVVSAVIYFGAEMLLKKTLRVWKSYKGYIGFLAMFAAMICFFAFTSFFGFETYIPEKEDVESVAIYDYYRSQKPYISNDETLANAIRIHNEMLERNETLTKRNYATRIHIEYALENGKNVHRVYPVDADTLHDIMNRLYKNEEYKQKVELIFTPMEKIYSVVLNNEWGNTTVIDNAEKTAELYECIKKDVQNLSYSQLNSDGWSFGIEIRYAGVKEVQEDVFAIIEAREYEEELRTRYMHLSVNTNYTNTIKWIVENGYWNSIALKNEGVMYIAREWNELPFFDEEGRLAKEDTGKDNFLKIESREDIQKIIDFCHNTPGEYIKENEKFRVFAVSDEYEKDYRGVTALTKTQIANLFPEKEWQKLR